MCAFFVSKKTADKRKNMCYNKYDPLKNEREVQKMKLIHLSDLHLGKRLNEYSFIEDQQHILLSIIGIIKDEKPDGVLIAGDVYDKAVASTEAITLFNKFLVRLSELDTQIFVISGNHDSPERLTSYGELLIDCIHIAPVYDGRVDPVVLSDSYGEVGIYMLPFIKPAHVSRYAEGQEIKTYTDAMRCAIEKMNVDKGRRNVLITHQFVTGADRCDSEEISVGGTDNVDACVFEPFDYVALGHLHAAQNCGKDTVRYCGTPLKYSFSESKHTKSVTVVELAEKGSVSVRTIPLKPLHDLVELKGSYDEVTSKAFYEGTSYQQDYTHITLTDEQDIPDAIGKLRSIYKRLMKLSYDNKRTRSNSVLTADEHVREKSPLELFSEFYEKQNNQPMSDEQTRFITEMIEKTWEAKQ